MSFNILIFRISIYIILICLSNCLLSKSVAQQHHQFYDKYTTQDGLPGDCITALMQDSKGYLWVGTSNGLAKFDGNKFTNFQQTNDTNSLGGHKISVIYEDKQGIIWVGSAGLNRYDRKINSWKRYVGLTKDTVNVSNEFVYSIVQENDSILWFLTLNGLNRLNKNTEQFDFYIYSKLLNWSGTKILGIDSSGKITFSNNSFPYVFNIKSRKYEKLLIFFKPKKIIANSTKINNERFLLKSGYIKIYNHKQQLQDSIYIGKSDIPNSYNIYCFLKEKNSTLWLGSIFGLYRVNLKGSFHFINNSKGLRNEYIRSVLVDSQNRVFLGTKGGYSFNINFNTESYLREFKIESINQLPDAHINNKIIELKNHNFLFISPSNISLYDNYKKKTICNLRNKSSTPYWSAIEISDGVLVGGISFPALIKIKIIDNVIKLDTVLEAVSSSICAFSMYRDLENQIWIGGQGLFKFNYKKDSKEYKFENYLLFNDPVNKNKNPVWEILDLNKDTLIVGTTENGLFLLDKHTKSFEHYTIKDGLSSDVISGLLKDKKGNIWISTINGLNVFNRKKKEFISFFEQDGLLSNDFNFKACDKNKDGWMFFGTKKGLVYFHPDSVKIEKFKFPLYINEFKTHDKVIKRELINGDTITLNHEQNFFTLEFSLLDFRNPKEIEYEYFLENYDNNFHITTGSYPRANYTNVPPGKYIFKLKAFDSKDKTVKNQIEIPIEIKPAVYQTFIFKFLIILVIILVISATIFQYIKRQILKGKMYKLELDLLRSQMNPHFIFNIMSSIQGIVMKNEKRKAVAYLAKFARLMRMNLNCSLSEYTSVEKTIQFLETYVKLESLNLNEAIEFEINIDNDIDQEKYQVSPMIIQPFIENAIIHGLAPRNVNMKLYFSMKKSGELILCKIKDNGIGRVKSAKINAAMKKGHESVGINITKRRNSLQLQKYIFKKDSIEITDNYDKNGNASGTEVSLRIAYVLNN